MEFIENISNLRGVLVVAYEEAVQLGKIYDIYLDKQTNHIKGISFKAGMIGIEKETFVSIENIRRMGKDVVIITNAAAAIPLPKEMEGSSLKSLKRFKITTHEGKHLGELSNLNVAMENGQISAFILSGNKIMEINAKDITIGVDAIMVPAEYASRIKDFEKHNAGLITGIFSTSTVGETVKETVEKIGEKVGQILKSNKSDKESIAEESDQKESKSPNVSMKKGKSDHAANSDEKMTVE